LPEPDGPVSITRPFERVTLSSCDSSDRKAAEPPNICDGALSRRLSAWFSRRNRLVSMPRRMTTRSWSILNGFSMKS
jgi:hypothetical protein